MNFKKFFYVCVLFVMLSPKIAHADKWLKLKFTQDINEGLLALEKHCLLNGLDSADVLWSNNLSLDDIKSGSVVYLPRNQAEMLSIWQHNGAWRPTALVPVNSAAVKKMHDASPAKPVKKIAQPQKNTQTPEQIIQQQIKMPVKNNAQDKILADAENKNKPEIKGLMDPVIIAEADGKKLSENTRLVLSGDRIELIKVPSNFVKTPSVEDLYASFGNPRDYLPKYTPFKKTVKNNPPVKKDLLNGKMLWPVVGRISSPFGVNRGSHKHAGIDIPMPAGTPIRAARSGVVLRTGNNSTPGYRGYGNFALVDHGGGMQTFYAHCSSISVTQGQKVVQGQIVGCVGNTGRSTANHLHFEVRVNNVKVNPVPYLAGETHLASHK